MATEIVLIRHGRTEWNVTHRYQGTSDTPLDDLGMQQSAALAQIMHGEHYDAISSSPLRRAWFTARPVAEALGWQPEEIMPDPRLIERTYGLAEGLTVPQREQQFPGERWEGLEPLDHVGMRALAVVNDYAAKFPGQRIILVTHGTWINTLLTVLSDGEVGQGISVIPNTSRTWITHHAHGWHIGDIGVADHLEMMP